MSAPLLLNKALVEEAGTAIVAVFAVLLALAWTPTAAAETPSPDAVEASSKSSRPLVLRISTASATLLQTETALAIPPSRDDAPSASVEMPWIWRELRRTAHQYLPKKNVDGVRARLAPTVVSSGFSTVPGAGLEGQF